MGLQAHQNFKLLTFLSHSHFSLLPSRTHFSLFSLLTSLLTSPIAAASNRRRLRRRRRIFALSLSLFSVGDYLDICISVGELDCVCVSPSLIIAIRSEVISLYSFAIRLILSCVCNSIFFTWIYAIRFFY
jgi:hypothetical protein